MASTPEGRRLTEAHRQAQQDVRDDFLAEFLALWALLDTNRLDDTGPGWIRAVTQLVIAYRLLSAEVATEYFWQFHELEADAPAPFDWNDTTSRPSGPVSPPAAPRTGRPPRQRQQRARREPQYPGRRPRGEDVIPDPRNSNVRFDIDEDEVRRSLERGRTRIEIPDIDWTERDRKVEIDLVIAGPVGQKTKIKRGKTPQEARDTSFVEAAGAGGRHVLTGGRESLLTLVRNNMREPRYIRVTDGDPCYFCAMLASRGPVYLTEASASFEAHDHCACTAEPVYDTRTAWPGRAAEFRRLWRQHIENRYSAAEARRQWRRIYTELQREQRRLDVA